MLHTEEVDLAMKHGLRTLKEIYTKFSGKFASPGQPKFMSLSEFMDVFADSGIFNDNFGSKQLPEKFAVSMMTQVDEIDSERHMNMSFCEFAEAFVRVAECTAIPNLVEDDKYTANQIADG